MQTTQTDFPTQWHGGVPETTCGAGSKVANMKAVIATLPDILKSLGATNVLELGCGDLNFAKHAIIPTGLPYSGVDIKSHESWDGYTCMEANVMDLASFDADVVVARDFFIHLPNDMILSILGKIKARYLISTTYKLVDNNIRGKRPGPGFSALDLSAEPFSLGNPLHLIPEHSHGKFLGVFKLEQR